MEKISSKRRGVPIEFLPIRFDFRNNLNPMNKIDLAFDAYLLSKLIGRDIRVVKVFHGDNHAQRAVNVSSAIQRIESTLVKISALLESASPPELVLNKHCPHCQFQHTCRTNAMRLDELTLLSGVSAKQRTHLRAKGIFTITQLSYTFRPRRRANRHQAKPEKYHPALRALAIRDKKIYTVGPLQDIPEGARVYLDVEGMPDQDFYYLIGLRIVHRRKSIQRCLWAEHAADERRLWSQFVTIIDNVPNPKLIHYGSYETLFLRRMCERYGRPPKGSMAENAITTATNLLSLIFARIYFPTYSNNLKEVASYLGFQHASPISGGNEAIVIRDLWQATQQSRYKDALISYNKDDCSALEIVANAVTKLSAESGTDPKDRGSVDISDLKRPHPYGFKRNVFAIHDMDAINNAAYWNYQRERVYVRSAHRPRIRRKRSTPTKSCFTPNKIVHLPIPARCPNCGSRVFYGHGKRRRTTIDLRFTSSGIRRCIIQFRFRRYRCNNCDTTFQHHRTTKIIGKYGLNLMGYSIYLNLDVGATQHRVDASMAKLFGIPLARGASHKFKAFLAQYYARAYQALIQKLCQGPLLHVDETRISVKGREGFVWVLASMTEVAYFYTPTREGNTIQSLLAKFKGVLVSDFYAAYDSVGCPQQKCLIHLIRDLNDLLLKHPYDQGLRTLAQKFSGLVRDIVHTIDRYGLKRRFLRKHRTHVQRFYRSLCQDDCATEASKKIVERFHKNRDRLFTFLEFNDVPWNNNNAEHAIKAFVPLRRTINGTTSEAGLKDYLVLLSLRETCKYRGVEFLDFIRSGSKDVAKFGIQR